MAKDAKRILLVEDDQFLSKVLITKLEQEGMTVLHAEDGEMATSMAFKEKPDIILLDLILPKQDGFGVLEDVKGDPKTKNIPVIIMSNLGQDSDIKRALNMGAVDYMVKARFSINAIVEKISKHLGKGDKGKTQTKVVEEELNGNKKKELEELKKQMDQLKSKISQIESE